MSNDFGLDLDQILRVVDTADVLIIRFQIVMDQRLLVDARSTAIDPPVVQLVPRAGSVEERFRSLKQLRPRFPLPDKIMSFQWPRHVATLAETGVWDRIVQRVTAAGHSGTAEMCEAIWRELLAAERREVITAITGGDRYQTLWQRHA